MRRPPRRRRTAIASMALATCGNTCSTACASLASSALIACTISKGLMRSISAVAALTFSVSNAPYSCSSRVLASCWADIYPSSYYEFMAEQTRFELRYQLFTLHMRIERVFVAAVDSFSVLEWLVAVGISGTAGEE